MYAQNVQDMEDIEAAKKQQIEIQELAAAATNLNNSTTKIHSTQNGGVIINNNSIKSPPNSGKMGVVQSEDEE